MMLVMQTRLSTCWKAKLKSVSWWGRSHSLFKTSMVQQTVGSVLWVSGGEREETEIGED